MEVSVETLAHGTKVCISRAHRFGTDAMLLSGFARPRRAETAVDLCSGCGIVALRWHDLGHRGPCRAVEVDPEGWNRPWPKTRPWATSRRSAPT